MNEEFVDLLMEYDEAVRRVTVEERYRDEVRQRLLAMHYRLVQDSAEPRLECTTDKSYTENRA